MSDASNKDFWRRRLEERRLEEQRAKQTGGSSTPAGSRPKQQIPKPKAAVPGASGNVTSPSATPKPQASRPTSAGSSSPFAMSQWAKVSRAFKPLLLLSLGVLVGLGAVIAYQYAFDGSTGEREMAEVEEGIDLIAAHPDDPDKPASLSGVSDQQIAELDLETVELMLSDDTIDVALQSDSARHLFAIGRVAMIHEQHETAYELLSLAAEAGSAPAYMYLADFFPDDVEHALELIGTSIEMGFPPASDVWDDVAALIDSQTSSSHGGGSPPAPLAGLASGIQIDLSTFHQPDLLAAMHAGGIGWKQVRARIPSGAPDFVHAAAKDPTIGNMTSELVSTLYAGKLAVTLSELATNETVEFLDPPYLIEMIDGNVSSEAEVWVATGQNMFRDRLLKLGADASNFSQYVSPLFEASSKELNAESGFELAEGIFQTYVGNQARSKATAALPAAIEQQARLDANKLKAFYYSTRTRPDVIRIYDGLKSVVASGRRGVSQ